MHHSPLDVRSSFAQGRGHIRLVGELDLETAPLFESALAIALREGPRHIVIDLRMVTFTDSTGVRAVLAAKGCCEEAACGFSVIPGRAPGAMRLWEVAGLSSVIPWETGGEPPVADSSAVRRRRTAGWWTPGRRSVGYPVP